MKSQKKSWLSLAILITLLSGVTIQSYAAESQIVESGSDAKDVSNAAITAQHEKWSNERVVNADGSVMYRLAADKNIEANAKTKDIYLAPNQENPKYTVFAPISVTNKANAVIDLNGHALQVVVGEGKGPGSWQSDGIGNVTGSGIYVDDGALVIENANKLAINYSKEAGDTYRHGMYVAGKLHIKNASGAENAVRIIGGSSGGSAAGWGRPVFVHNEHGSLGRLTVDGSLDIDATRNWVGLDVTKGQARIGGGKVQIGNNGGTAMTVNSHGKLYFGKDGALVQVTGDIASQNASTLDLKLTTPESFLKGRFINYVYVPNAGYGSYSSADAYLTLKNGATWYNKQVGSIDWRNYGQEGKPASTYLYTVTADKGILVNEDGAELGIKKFSGNLTIKYPHKAGTKGAADADYTGGRIIIDSAERGSTVVLLTNPDGLDMNNNSEVTTTLNTLAGKLTYKEAPEGRHYLQGTVAIAEGLLTPAATMRFTRELLFDKSGKGQVGSNATPPLPPQGGDSVYKVQIVEDFNYSRDHRAYWAKQDHIYDNSGKYTFNNDVRLDVNPQSQYFVGVWGARDSFGAIQWKRDDTTGTIDLRGHKLILNPSTYEMDHIGPMGITVHSGTLTLKNVNGIDINSQGGQHGMGIHVYGTQTKENGSGFHAGNGLAELIIENDINPEHAVKIRVNTYHNYGGIFVNPNSSGHAVLNIKGLVDVDVDENEAIVSWGKAYIGGGKIKSTGSLALQAGFDGGLLWVNSVTDDNGYVGAKNKNAPLQIDGDSVSFGNANLRIGLATGDSYINGLIVTDLQGLRSSDHQWGHNPGEAHLYMGKNTRWINHQYGMGVYTSVAYIDKDGRKVWTGQDMPELGSHLTQLVSDGGSIFQQHKKDLTVDELRGNVTLLYKHAGDGTRAEDYAAGDTHIRSAYAGADVLVITDRNGIAVDDESKVLTALNTLAGKVYYDNYAKGERNLTGKARIAEGLTAASQEVNFGTIVFQESNGRGTVNTLGRKKVKPVGAQVYARQIAEGEARGDVRSINAQWDKAGVRTSDGHYAFTADTTIKLASGTAKDNEKRYGAIHWNRAGEGVIDMGGNKLNLDVNVKHGHYGIGILQNDGTLIIRNVGDMKISMHGNLSDNTVISGVRLYSKNGPSKLIIENEGRTLSVHDGVSLGTRGGVDGMLVASSANGNDAEIDVKGLVDLQANGRTGVYVYTAGTVRMGGGKITTNGNAIAINRDKNTLPAAVYMNAMVENDSVKALTSKNPVQIKGNVEAGDKANSLVALGLVTEESFLQGRIGSGKEAKAYLVLQNKAKWMNNGYSRLTQLAGGTDAAHAGIIAQQDANDINIDNYSGHTVVLYKHENASPTTMIGGNIRIGKAVAGSGITLRTDNAGLHTDSEDAAAVKTVNDTLNALANKLYYQAYVTGERNLTGKVEIAEGLTAQSVSRKLGDIAFKDADGQGEYKATAPNPNPSDPPKPNPSDPPKPNPNPSDPPKPNPNPNDPSIIYGPKETAMMRGAKSAMSGAVLNWRAENNDLAKRLGDLRLANGESGAWGRIYGGKLSYDKNNAQADTKFKAVQVGYDKTVAKDWRAGVAFSYLEGDNKYGGKNSGETKLTNLALYGTKTAGGGSYVDIVAKVSRLANEYTVYNDMGHQLNGDYKTWGMTASAEAGRRVERGNGNYAGYYGQLVYGHVAGKDYDAKSDFGGGKVMHVSQDAVNSLVGRAGVRLGRDGATSSWYVKAAVAHEFAGDLKTTYSAAGEPTSSTKQELKDTWFELGIGGTMQLGADKYMYADVERSFGADLQTDWRVNAGVRVFF